jgi:hypothetical protein
MFIIYLNKLLVPYNGTVTHIIVAVPYNGTRHYLVANKVQSYCKL